MITSGAVYFVAAVILEVGVSKGSESNTIKRLGYSIYTQLLTTIPY